MDGRIDSMYVRACVRQSVQCCCCSCWLPLLRGLFLVEIRRDTIVP